MPNDMFANCFHNLINRYIPNRPFQTSKLTNPFTPCSGNLSEYIGVHGRPCYNQCIELNYPFTHLVTEMDKGTFNLKV